jgi:glyoxylase-like metal-dependent hydrolase (beta-lactamase superfamily II)
MSQSLPHPDVAAFFDPATNTVSYIVSDPATGAAAIIDPVLDFTASNARTSTASADALLDYLTRNGLDLVWLLETHAHADHLSSAHYLQEKTGVPIVIGDRIRLVQAHFAPLFGADDLVPDGSVFQSLLKDGDELMLGELRLLAMHTPGHTPACMTYVIGDAAFVGDTLFMPDYGTARCDFPGGDAAMLYRSIQRILALPDATRIFVGHDYLPAGRSDFRWESSVADQRAHNIHVHQSISEAEFVAMRRARDATLSAPQLILPSLQVNIRAGAMPPADAAGRTWLRLPVNII